MALRVLQWQGARCVYCSVGSLRKLGPTDVLPVSRHGLLPKGSLLQWRVTVLTHYCGPIAYLHVPLYCSECQNIYFHNFVVPGPLLHEGVRMELAGDPSGFLCLQTGFTDIAFGIDLVRYYESLAATDSISYQGFMRGYASFWQTSACAKDTVVTLFTRAQLLFALIDFLALPGVSAWHFLFWLQMVASTHLSSSFHHDIPRRTLHPWPSSDATFWRQSPADILAISVCFRV